MRLRSLLSRLMRSQNPYIPYLVSPDNGRIAFPQIQLSRYSKTRHFGGSLQTNDMLPSNYVAVTAFAEGSSMVGYPARFLHNIIERKRTTNMNVQDYTICFGKGDMTRNRAIGSIRFVHLNSTAATLLKNDTFEREVNSNESNCASTMSITRETEYSDRNVDEPDGSELDALKEILYNIPVPVKKEVGPVGGHNIEMTNVQVLDMISEDEINRHLIAAGRDMKEVAIRIIQTAAW